MIIQSVIGTTLDSHISLIVQVLAILGAGVGAATFVDRKIQAFEARFQEKLDRLAIGCVNQRECSMIFNNCQKRFDHIELKAENMELRLGNLAQKAQLLMLRDDFGLKDAVKD